MDPWIRLLEIFDKHPVLFGIALAVVGVLLLVLGTMAITFGIRIPQRTKLEDGSTVWALSGGVPGLGTGLVAVGKGLIEFTHTFATEREKDRTAHAAELQATKNAIDAVRAEQAATRAEQAVTNRAIERLTTELHEVVVAVKELIKGQERTEKTRESISGTDLSKGARCS
jgi:hypothetical protein